MINTLTPPAERGGDPDALGIENDGWLPPEQHPGGWTEIRADFPRLLSMGQALHAAGCLGYALRARMNGPRLSLPTVTIQLAGDIDNYATTDKERFAGLTCSVLFFYDSELCANRNFDATKSAFEDAAEYIVEGSPIRQADKKRLCEGIGNAGSGVKFYVR